MAPGAGLLHAPDSREMVRHFLSLGDPEMAGRFRPSSMECIRSHGGDPLTLVSEMPLFIVPGFDADEPAGGATMFSWRARLGEWKLRLLDGEDRERIRSDAADAGMVAMPVHDQMRLQWAFVSAGVDQVRAAITAG